MKSKNLCLTLLLLTGLPLAGKVAAAPKKKAPAKAKKAVAPKSAKPAAPRLEDLTAAIDEHPFIKSFKTVDAGPGVWVCEPVVKGADAETGAFGAGCTRWLLLTLGGYGELGRTPYWSSGADMLKELKRSDFRLTLDQAVALEQPMGLTHVVVSEISGSADKVTLRLQLHALPSRKPVGEPVVLQGDEATVLGKLPSVAQGMAAGMGVKSPSLPREVEEKPEEMRVCGKVPWMPLPTDASEAVSALAGIGKRPLVVRQFANQNASSKFNDVLRERQPTLALFLQLLRHATPNETLSKVFTGWDALPENPMAHTELGRALARAAGSGRYIGAPKGIEELIQRYPNNLCLNASVVYIPLPPARVTETRASGERLVQAAPRSVEAWLLLADAISEESEAIRRSRTADKITEAEWKKLGVLYEEWLAASLKAAQLRPERQRVWREVSVSATFLGVMELADRACSRALGMDGADAATVWWAAELYQPKWLDNPQKLQKVAEKAIAAADGWTSKFRVSTAFSFHCAGLTDAAQQVLRTEEDRTEFAKRTARLNR